MAGVGIRLGTCSQDIRDAGRPNVHVFSPNCVIHTFTYGPSWWEIQIDGISSRDVIGALARGEDMEPRVIADDCAGISCSVGCSASAVASATQEAW